MSKKYLMKGNEAFAEAAIQAGCKYFFGYPITPQTEVAAYMAKKLPKIDGVYMQAESEIAAINMVLGAASTGVRTLTSTSSPGLSLKAECISYIAASDIPCVIINVQRGGPGLGGIQPSQADYWQATKATGHGDFHLMIFAPSTVQEIVDVVDKAFDLSDKYRVPAMILADGILGQMMEPVEFKSSFSKGVDKPWALTGTKNKRSPNIINSLDLIPENLEKTTIERFQRYNQIKQNEQMCEEYLMDDAEFAVVAYGATARVVKQAIKEIRNKGLKVGLIRPITLWPFPENTINKHIVNIKSVLCVEMSMGQMIDDVKLVANGRCDVEFLGRTGGCVPTCDAIVDKLLEMSGGVE